MAIFKLEENKLKELRQTSFANENLSEVKDIQNFIVNSIETIENDLFVISTEFGDWEDSRRRIDILCIDKNANLVVIELKRTEDGGHMELQSIRYAAMIANMTFDKAVKTYIKHLEKHNKPTENAEEEILNFLDWSDKNEEDFANDVRIILVSADFSIEITTTVLWLIERDIDVKCIRIRPHKDGENIYFDIQQIIPLPETTDYQVKIREKATEQRQARRESQRDYSKFDVTINGKEYHKLDKRATMILAIKECINNGISPDELAEITGKGKWIYVDKICTNRKDFESEYTLTGKRKYDESRWFNADNELLVFQNRTYVYSNQQGKDTERIVIEIFKKYVQLNSTIKKNDS